MEFLGGIIFTLALIGAGYLIHNSWQKRKTDRLPPDYQPKVPKDFVKPKDRIG